VVLSTNKATILENYEELIKQETIVSKSWSQITGIAGLFGKKGKN
jgi:hypothetical protein